MAALGNTVDSGSGASGDYVSLNALETAQQQDLTDGGGDTYTATCTTTGDNAADTTATTFVGWTTGATNYIQIEAASGDETVASGRDTNKYRLEITDGSCLTLQEDYMRILQLQISSNSATAGAECISVVSANVANEIRIGNCYLKGLGANTNYGIITNDPDTILKIWNTIITGFAQDGIRIIDCTTTDIYNCIVHNSTFNNIRRHAGTITVKNTASFKASDDFNGTITVDYCASDDNDGTNNVVESGGGVDWPDDFEDAAAGDFRLKSGSNLVDGGTDDPGSGLYSDDIEGTARGSPWDVGAFEFVAADGINRIPIIDHHNRMMAMMGG